MGERTRNTQNKRKTLNQLNTDLDGLSKLNICFLAGTLGQGGAERQLYYTLRTLKEYGATLRVLSLTAGEFWDEKFKSMGIPVIFVGRDKSRLVRLKKIISELRKSPPQLIQSQHFYANLYAVGAARFLGLREVGALRGDAVYEVWSTGRIMGNLGMRAPRIIAANSEAAIRKVASLGVPRHRLHLLRNVVDTDYFAPTNSKNGRAITIATIGRFVRQKRIDRLLSIFAAVRSQTPAELRLVIAGDGPLRSELERQAAELGLSGSIDFRGVVSDARSIYAETDIFALTSDWEGTPNVTLEAMACGLPVIARAVGDIPEIIHDGKDGLLVAPPDEEKDEEKMVAAFLKLIHNSGLRKDLGRQARDQMVSEFSPQQLPQRLQHFYKAVLQ